MKKKIIAVLFMIFICALIPGGCKKDKMMSEQAGIWEKGYDLPISEEEQETARSDCRILMKKISRIYDNIYKNSMTEGRISYEAAAQIMEEVKDTGKPVSAERFSLNMSNYEKMDAFLKLALRGEAADMVLYEILADGSIGRRHFQFDGEDMYELYTSGRLDNEGNPVVMMPVYNKLKEWNYTEKGWFWYEYCVPEPPEVTEIVDGSVMLRVGPLQKEYRDIATEYLIPVAYQGNNLLCSDWSAESMQNIDYNGLYPYLYAIKYQRRYEQEEGAEGIPKEDFERLLTEYLPVTAEELQRMAAYDEEKQIYVYAELGCGNNVLSAFSTSIPEITYMQENEDGTVTLTVDAVCESLGKDAVITHKLTVEFAGDGGIRYLANEIQEDGLERIPGYRYRIPKNN